MNRSAKAVTAEVAIDASALHRTQHAQVMDLVDRTTVQSRFADGRIGLTLKLGPEQATLIEVRE